MCCSKKIAYIGLLSSFLLTACHHENPLKTQPIKESALFLVNASANAEKRLHFSIQKDSYGFGYLECMDGKKSAEIRCPELLNGMLIFAKENHYPAFRSIRLENLRDPTVFEKIADDYAEIAVSSWPQFFPMEPS